MINSKAKGAKGEREWASFCREQGYDVRRTQQYCGATEESADCVGLPGIHQEVKRVQALNLDHALEQTYSDYLKNRHITKIYETGLSHECDTGYKIPIVAHRKNGKKWKVTMYADDWFRLYREWEAGR